MGTVTRTKFQRNRPIDAYLLRLQASNTSGDTARYPSSQNIGQDPFYRLFIPGVLSYRKTDALTPQEFQIEMTGQGTDVVLWSRYFLAADVTPTAAIGEEWQSGSNRLSMYGAVPSGIIPPGVALQVSTQLNSNPSDIRLDLLMFESLDPDELRALI